MTRMAACGAWFRIPAVWRLLVPPNFFIKFPKLDSGWSFLFLYITFVGYMHQQYQTKFPSVDAICPFGGIESLYSLIFQGNFLNRVLSSAIILLIITMVLVFISGRSFCGWICPLGTMQGIMNGLGKRIMK